MRKRKQRTEGEREGGRDIDRQTEKQCFSFRLITCTQKSKLTPEEI